MLERGGINNNSNDELKEINSVQFGLMSPENIVNMSVIEVDNPRSFDDNGKPSKGGINDQRMGPFDIKSRCETCNCNYEECPGHFGYISLVKPVFHVYFIKECLLLLKCICKNCSKILINDEDYKRISKIRNAKQRKKEIYNSIKSNKPCENCEHEQNKYKKVGLKIYEIIINRNRIELKPETIYTIFKRISDKDCLLFGFNPKYARPEWMIIQKLIVCPPAARPSVSVDSSLRAQDDLTNQYNEILKINRYLDEQIKRNATEAIISDIFDRLQISVATLIDNNLSIGKAFKKNGEPIKCLFSRINGKEGIIRGNLMGKRVDFSARSVISPDPNLQVDEIGIPLSIAMNLTYPEEYSNLRNQKAKLKKLINNGPLKYPGAKHVITKEGKISCKYFKQELEIGDIVERHILDGDIIVFNRQPSLHKMSMMGFRVKILPYLTFRLNLSITTPFNADFDGDEMNLHLPQSIPSKVEVKNIMDVSKQVISPQSNRPVMGIVQDSLVGCSLFTSRDTFLTYEETMSLIFLIDNFDIRNLPMPCIFKPQALWSGKQIFSLILPKNLNFSRFRDDTPEGLCNKLNILDNFVEIKNGELYQGIICKKSIGSSCSGGITHCIWKMNPAYIRDRTNNGPKLALKFLGQCQKIINKFLISKGFSVGISDTLCNPETNIKIGNIIKDMKDNIKTILSDAKEGKLKGQIGKNTIDSFEIQSNLELNNASSLAGKEVKDSLLQNNNLNNMVSSGSKGNLTNISQIMAFVGQQNVEGKRISFDFKYRTLPHFLKFDYEPESKGFIKNSFIKGLNPQEFFFHAKAGREGIIDTAIKTAKSGYIQRRLIKSLEDIKAEYDGTVRNSKREIIQFIYGEDGLAGEYIEDQVFETLNMNDEILEKNFKFSNNLLRNYINNNPNLNLNENVLRRILKDEFNQIKQDRDDVRKILINRDNIIHIPVNIKRIIMNAETMGNNQRKLNPLKILEKIRKLKRKLKIINGEDKKEEQDCALYLFSKVLNYSLSTKNIIINHKLNKDSFKYICKEIKYQFLKAIVNPGEMVGCLASQSLGEPATQMTLNTFHLAGVSSVNITLGIPRLKEIIDISNNMKTPSMTIYLKEDKILDIKNVINNEKLLQILNKIEYTLFNEIIEKSEIYYDPDLKNSIIDEDRDMVDDYIDLGERKFNEIYNNNYISPWVLRLIFKREKLINIKLKEIKTIIKNNACYNTFIIGVSNKMQIRFISQKEKNEEKGKRGKKGKKEENEEDKNDKNANLDFKSLEALRQFQIKITNLPLNGIEKIKKVYIKKIQKIVYDKNNGNLITPPPEEYVFETEGSNLMKIFELDEVDFKRTISNDINDIYEVLGIEAARKILIEEIKKLFNAYGIYINYRHISILCDYMTQKGILVPISRHGLKKVGFGPIRRATYEEGAKNLLEAGINCEKDQLNGVSEQILYGKLPKIGTNFFSLLYQNE